MLPDYLEGAIDLHVHSSPDVDERRYDDIELANEAARAGMGAILIKSHVNSTAERAVLVSKIVPRIRVYGGIVLNESIGGFNAAAVSAALTIGARQVWLPTRSALNHRRAHGQDGGLTVLDGSGRLRPEIDTILQSVAQAHCILGTGHLAPDEVFPLVSRARALGVERILITHPEWFVTSYTIQQQRELALSGVMFERCFVSTTHRCRHTPMSVIERAITDVGVATTVLATDLGQPDTPAPVDGLRAFAERLRSSGFSADDLRRMMRENPEAMLRKPALTASGAIPV